MSITCQIIAVKAADFAVSRSGDLCYCYSFIYSRLHRDLGPSETKCINELVGGFTIEQNPILTSNECEELYLIFETCKKANSYICLLTCILVEPFTK